MKIKDHSQRKMQTLQFEDHSQRKMQTLQLSKSLLLKSFFRYDELKMHKQKLIKDQNNE